MTPEQHDAFTRQVTLDTNATNVGVLMVNILILNLLVIDIACFVIAVGLVIFSHIQCRKAERRYQQKVKEYLEAGGTVMLVKRGRRWMPVPIDIWHHYGHDLS